MRGMVLCLNEKSVHSFITYHFSFNSTPFTSHSSFLTSLSIQLQVKIWVRELNRSEEEKNVMCSFFISFVFKLNTILFLFVLGVFNLKQKKEEGNERKKKKWSETKRTERASFPYHYLCSFFHFSSLLFFHSVLTVHSSFNCQAWVSLCLLLLFCFFFLSVKFMLSLPFHYNLTERKRNQPTWLSPLGCSCIVRSEWFCSFCF